MLLFLLLYLGPGDGALDVNVSLQPDLLHLGQERRRGEVRQRLVIIVLEQERKITSERVRE